MATHFYIGKPHEKEGKRLTLGQFLAGVSFTGFVLVAAVWYLFFR